MKKTNNKFNEIIETLDELQFDIDVSYEIRDTRPDICTYYKKLIKNSIDEIIRLDWNCNTDETIKITDKIISIQGQLKLY